MLFTKLFNRLAIVGFALMLCHGSQTSYAMERFEDREERAKSANQCVNCYQQTTPTSIVHCTRCPSTFDHRHFLADLNRQERHISLGLQHILLQNILFHTPVFTLPAIEYRILPDLLGPLAMINNGTKESDEENDRT